MKKPILLISYLIISLTIFGQEAIIPNQDLSSFFPKPKVDKRIELLSIVFRLAGNEEYNDENFKVYSNDIHTYFDKFKDHPLISFASKLRKDKWVSYDAVMYMAFHINQPPSLTPKIEFTDDIPEKRWGKDNSLKFLELLRDFYIVSDFEKFYNEHSDLYKLTEVRFLPVYKSLNIDWYNKYYGVKPDGSFNVIICLGNGGGNYGGKVIYPDHKEEAYAIMGTWTFDSINNPVYKIEDYLPTLIHEFNHSYVNPLIYRYSNQLESSGKIIFEPIKNILRKQSYGNWKTMMLESVVRASVIRYSLKFDSYEVARNQLITEMGSNGFYYMQDLVNLLSDYENNQIKYPNLESFMPVIIDFFDKTALNSESMYVIRK